VEKNPTETPAIYYSMENNTLGEAALLRVMDVGEENIHGQFISEPIRKGHRRKFRRGFNTTAKHKIAACAKFKELVESGKLTDRLAREVLTGVLAGEGDPVAIVAARGLEVVSDDGALLAAIDKVLADQPDVLEKIREGKLQAAGAVIGAVMKAMSGSADAARVRELVIQRATEG
jgi:Asp-tRNA(Asn)/Glu-tRNA(Gln) amidotransferase B subunit